ncbi:hypothetical protein WKN98_001644 [Escherichia coli]
MLHELDDEDFIALVSPEIEDELEQQINLSAERNNTPITWHEFAGNFN